MSSPWRRRASFAVQAVVSIVLLGYVASLLDWTQIRALGRDGLLLGMWPGPLCLMAGLLAAALRWRMLLRSQNIFLSQAAAYLIYLRATFFGVFLPGVLGGDVVRAVMCANATRGSVSAIGASIVFERLCGVWCLAAIGTVGSMLLPGAIQSQVSMVALWVTPLLAVALPVLLWAVLRWSAHQHKLGAWFAGGLLERGVRFLGRVSPALSTGLPGVLIAGFAFQACEMVVFWYFGKLLGLAVPWSVWLFVVPLVYLMTVLPVSLGGLGVREAALVGLLSLAGVSGATAALLAFLVYLNRVLVAFAGAAFWISPRALRVSGNALDARREHRPD